MQKFPYFGDVFDELKADCMKKMELALGSATTTTMKNPELGEKNSKGEDVYEELLRSPAIGVRLGALTMDLTKNSLCWGYAEGRLVAAIQQILHEWRPFFCSRAQRTLDYAIPLNCQIMHYPPNVERPLHHDPPCYDIIVGLNLVNGTVLGLKAIQGDQEPVVIPLAEEDLYIMTADALTEYKHEVSASLEEDGRTVLLLRYASLHIVSEARKIWKQNKT